VIQSTSYFKKFLQYYYVLVGIYELYLQKKISSIDVRLSMYLIDTNQVELSYARALSDVTCLELRTVTLRASCRGYINVVILSRL